MDGISSGSRSTAGSNAFFLIIGWISAIVSLFIYPLIFGVLGVIMGILATKNRSRAGFPVIVASILLMGIGLIFSGVFRNYLMHYASRIFKF